MIAALLLTSVALNVRLTPNETLTYVESFRVTEVGAPGTAELRASGSRKQTWKIGEIKKGVATVEATYSDIEAKADAGGDEALATAARLKKAILRDPLTFQMNERGIVNAPIFPNGSRPFFGLVLPQKADPLPDNWGEKLIAPFGPDKAVDFKYRFVGLSPVDTGAIYQIGVRATMEDKTSKFNLSGDVFLSDQGRLVRSEIDARWEENGFVTAIAYRATPSP